MTANVLCVDIGNTSSKLALVGPDRIVPVGAVSSDDLRKDPAVAGRLLTSEKSSPKGVVGVALSSVVPPLDEPLSTVLRDAMGVEVCRIDHTSRLPFRLRVDNPASLGGDRICAVAGAMGKRGGGAIVVDIGSAVTVDLLDRGAFWGGLILVGPLLGLRALGEYASRLPVIDEMSTKDAFPTRFSDTVPSMILGANLGTVGAIKEAVRLLQDKGSGRLRVFVTGGLAKGFVKRLPRSWVLDPNLVFKGMYRIWRLNPVWM
ncbi:MAG: type III pantothenate kinase [Candidatus Latescibacterota bacterium]|nr:MAG: type III pantothenate kinase [Candidatus Latescibacterota bacterium]